MNEISSTVALNMTKRKNKLSIQKILEMQKLNYDREKYYLDIIGLNNDETTTNSKEIRASTCMNLLLPQRIIMSYFIKAAHVFEALWQ